MRKIEVRDINIGPRFTDDDGDFRPVTIKVGYGDVLITGSLHVTTRVPVSDGETIEQFVRTRPRVRTHRS